MKIARWIARALCTVLVAIVGFYTMVAAAVALLIGAGNLIPGQVMYFDLVTPTLSGTLLFAAAGSIVVAALAFARKWFGARASLIQPNVRGAP